jgi:hypothetical protein
MLAFLKTDPARKLRREIDASSAKSSKLAARLEATASEVAELSQAPTRLARGGADDAALMSARAKVEDAKALVAMLSDAVAEEEKLHAGLEQQLADLTDRAQREESADRCDQLSVEMESFEQKIKVLDDLANLADIVAPIVVDASAIGHFARRTHAEIIPALTLLSSLLNSHARGVRSGAYPTMLPTPAAVPIPLPPVPENEAIWLIQPVAFSENGQIVVRDMNQYLRLPPALATRAVEVGAGVRIGDPRAGKQVGSWRQWHGFGGPSLARSQHLDNEAIAAAAEEKQKTLPQSEIVRQVHSLFEPVNRGPAYQMRTNGPSHTPDESGNGQ